MKSLSLSQQRAQEQVKAKFNYQKYHQFEFEEKINSLNIDDNQLTIFSEQNKKLIIMDLIRQKQFKQIRLKQNEEKNVITQIEQSFNQKLFFLIDNLGKIIIIRNDGYSKQMNSIQFNGEYVICFKQLDSSQIITAHPGGQVIITDIVLRKQLFQLKSHQYYILQIEYDYKHNVIITVANDQSVQFFKLNGEKIIDQQNAHQYGRLTIFLTTDNKLISASIDVLKFWKIDYINKSLTLLKCVESNNLHYLNQTVDKKYFILIDKIHIKFIDHNLDFKQQKHLLYNISFQNYINPSEKLSIQNNFIAVLCQENNFSWINILKKLT